METPKRRCGSDLLVTRYAGQVIVLDRAASTYHHLNPLATFVWERCDGETDLATIAVDVADVFESPSSEELVEAALQRLEGAGLLEGAAQTDLSTSPGTPPAPTR